MAVEYETKMASASSTVERVSPVPGLRQSATAWKFTFEGRNYKRATQEEAEALYKELTEEPEV